MRISKIVSKGNFLHMYYSDFSDLKISVLHGIVATQLNSGGTFNNCVIANCPQNVAVKKFENRLIFDKDMKNDKVGRF